MVQYFDEIPSFLVEWIKLQRVFWVATAPLSTDGHVNLSGKGNDGTFNVVDNRKVWYEDLTGSGCETISHVKENGRITIYFNAFEGPPRIARLFGKGTVYEFGTPEYNALNPPEKRSPGSRSIIVIDVHKVATSCGYAIPFFDFKAYRPKYNQAAINFEDPDIAAQEKDASGKSENGLKAYWMKHSLKSIDGLPGMDLLPQTMNAPIVLTGKGISVREALKMAKYKVQAGQQRILRPTLVPNIQLLIGFVLGLLAVVIWGRTRSILGEKLDLNLAS